MSRLETAIERLRALPPDEHDAIAGEIEAILSEPASLLTVEQWEAVDRELAGADDGTNLTHGDVVGRMRKRFGR